MTVETVVLDSGLSFIREAIITEIPISVSSYKIGSAAGFSGDSSATDVSGTLVYSGEQTQFTTAIDADGNLIFTITLDETIGSFSIGNFLLFTTNASGNESSPFIHVILPFALPKTATVGPDPGNVLVFRITVGVIDGTATTTLNVTVADENIGVLPSVANESLLPAPGPSAYQHYVVQELIATNTPALAMRRVSDDTWWGNGFVNRIDDHRFGWAFGGFFGDGYQIKTNATVFGGFFETASGKFTSVVDGGDAWAVGSSVLDGGTWS